MKIKQCTVCLQYVPLWKSNPATCKSCMPKKPIKSATKIGDYTMRKVTIQATKKPKPIKSVSDKEKKRQVAYMALRNVYMEQNNRCMFKDCMNRSTECHHVRGRTGKLLLDTSEWMALCTEHHQHIHEHDKESRELGYLKSRLGN